jgi:hypothetical protein
MSTLTDEQIAEIALKTVYQGDATTPYRADWTAEIGIPFARAIERAIAARAESAEAERDRLREALIACRPSVRMDLSAWERMELQGRPEATEEANRLQTLLDTIDAADTKIPAPVVQSFAGLLAWAIPHTTYILPERYRYGRHLFCDAADVETYAAAREAAARQEERDAQIAKRAKLTKVLHAAVALVRSPSWSGISDEDCELERVLVECGFLDRAS